MINYNFLDTLLYQLYVENKVGMTMTITIVKILIQNLDVRKKGRLRLLYELVIRYQVS